MGTIDACVLPSVSENFGKKVVNSLSDEQLKSYHISDYYSKENRQAIELAIADFISSFAGAERDEDRRDQILNKPEEFAELLDKVFMVHRLSESQYEDALNQIEAFHNWCTENKFLLADIDSFDIDLSEKQQDLAKAIITKFKTFDKIMDFRVRYDKDGNIKRISWFLLKPVKDDSVDPKQRTLEVIERIKEQTIDGKYPLIEIQKIGTTERKTVQYRNQIPQGWEETGRKVYIYNGRPITTESVTKTSPNTEFPVLSAPVGDAVDKTGRMFFNKESLFYKDGKLVDDETLKTIIDTELNGLFTVQGLKNLLNDFKQLEDQLKQTWGKDITIISEEIQLFSQNKDSDTWTTGKPDLLVIDSSGKVHVLDFKTYKMTNTDGYSMIDDTRSEHYSQQVSSYINMLEAYGLDVDRTPYIVQVDTFYDSTDKGEKNNFDNKGHLREGYSNTYHVEKTTTEGTKVLINETPDSPEMTLAEYLDKNPKATRENVFEESDKQILYIEPRLHVAGYNEKTGFSKELGALRSTESNLKFIPMSYERQWDALPQEERKEMEEMFGKPVHVKPAQDVVALSEDNIESRPELISSQEIQYLANLIMMETSHIITNLSLGAFYPGISLSHTYGTDNTAKSPLQGMSRSEIIKAVGIENLIEEALKPIKSQNSYFKVFPSLEDYQNNNFESKVFKFKNEEDYNRQKRLTEKAHWLLEHKQQLIIRGYAKLIALEKCLAPRYTQQDIQKSLSDSTPATVMSPANAFDVTEDEGDEASLQSFADQYSEGLTDVEAWMIGIRNMSPRSSLAQEVRRMLEDLPLVDEDGKTIKDYYGWGYKLTVDPTMAIQTIFDITNDCETFEEMHEALTNAIQSSGNKWIQRLLGTIDRPGNENLKIKFFRHFRKDRLNYSICEVKFDKETGNRTVRTRIVNSKSAYSSILQNIGADLFQGKLGEFTIGDETFSLLSQGLVNGKQGTTFTVVGSSKNPVTVADYVKDEIKKWKEVIEKLYSNPHYHKLGSQEKRAQWILTELQKPQSTFGKKASLNKKTVIQGITEMLKAVGIYVTPDVILSTVADNLKGKHTNNAIALLNDVQGIIEAFNNYVNKEHIPIPNSWERNPAFGAYGGKKGIVTLIAKYVQDHVESSVYQDGKTYYSFTNPSNLHHTLRNLKNSLQNQAKFEKYIKDNFGRYDWYVERNSNGTITYLCDWVDQFVKGQGSNVLDHKCELSYLRNKYRDLGALGFQLSILHNYFGSAYEQKENLHWFAVPTMSNKPVNEFIRMTEYKLNKGTTSWEELQDKESYRYNIILDQVQMKTFRQEIKRIVDVLYHYADNQTPVDKMDLTDKTLKKAGWKSEDIQGLKDRINNHTVTANDIIKLSYVTSGAKFHFLWYLNSEIANNKDFADCIIRKINYLLTPEGSDKTVDLSQETDANKLIKDAIARNMESIVEEELNRMEKIGLFDTETHNIQGKDVEVLTYLEEFNGALGENREEMEQALRDFIWQDIAANINIIEITGGDLAYFGNAVNYQKRIAQEHSPGLHVMHNDQYDDGYFRTVHISDQTMREEISTNIQVALEEYLENHKATMTAAEIEDYKNMITAILDKLSDALVTDGQSFNSISSARKKLLMQGEWTEDMETAYDEISKGNFNINNLAILIQPVKPFVTAQLPKYSDSPTMSLRKVPVQEKNSEYTLILAEALARSSGKRSKLVAISDFMERTCNKKFNGGKTGIDTVHFESVNKVGKSGVIDIAAFDRQFEQDLKEGKVSEEDYNSLLTDYLLEKVSRNSLNEEQRKYEDGLVQNGTLTHNETLYNTVYVDTVPVENYIIQQEVPAHFLEHEQLYGSQSRILGISDITPGTKFDVKGESVEAEDLIKEFKELHAENIHASYIELLHELGIDNDIDINDLFDAQTGTIKKEFQSALDSPRTAERNKRYEKLASLLQTEIFKDAKYGIDMLRACTLQYDTSGNVIDFTVPLMDPIQSNRIQMLINSIIKKRINKQEINGGPVVQTTAYDKDLHIRFKDKDGNILKTFTEYGKSPEDYKKYLKENQAGIAYFECYLPVPNAALEKLMTKEDGSMMSFEELQQKLPKKVWDSISRVIGYRIPTEDKYSMIPLKIMGFVPKAAGQVIVMPQEITFLTGSDFDIDKMYIMMKSFNINDNTSKGSLNHLIKQYSIDHHNNTFPDIHRIMKQVIKNGSEILQGNNISWDHLLERDVNNPKVKELINWYKDYLLKNAFTEYTDKKSTNVRKAKQARNNRILDLQWAVLTNEDTTSKMLNPGNFDEEKKIGRIIKIRKANIINPLTKELYKPEDLAKLSLDQLDNLLDAQDPHNTTLPSTKIYFQHQNMQGTQMTGLFANANVSHAFCSFQKIGIDLSNGLDDDGSFILDGHRIGDPQNPTVLDALTGFNGQLISKVLASFLAASVDTAKDPSHSDLNINTFTGNIAATLARIGFDTTLIGYFLAQPVLVDLADLYYKNSTNGVYTAEMAIKEMAARLDMSDKELEDISGDINKANEITKKALWDNMNKDYNDNKTANIFAKKVLKAFYNLNKIATDVRDLTFCTKFNSVTNAAGPTIMDSEQDKEKVEKFIDRVKNGETCFFLPEFIENETESGFTDPTQIIENDPILSAFYYSTIGDGGASEIIFKQFFPHYFPGFKNVKEIFMKDYLKRNGLDSTLGNKLINAYIYYLLTYSDENFKPTLPSSPKDQRKLVRDLVTDFKKVQNIKNRKPNVLLDQALGANCLKIRNADTYLAQDILVFDSGGLNNDAQQQIRDAWSDLITMQDPDLSEEENEDIRNFGNKLFFYTLMRNGFGFSPKTLMHLASVIVRYNATYADGYCNYIEGLRQLYDLDKYLTSPSIANSTYLTRFLNQFMRNNAGNSQLIPNINSWNKLIVDHSQDNDYIILGASSKERYKLNKVILRGTTPYKFITITRKENGKLYRDLYQIDDTNINDASLEFDQYRIKYNKVPILGLTNNFIEYNANEDIEESYFEKIRDESEDAMDEETDGQRATSDEIRNLDNGESSEDRVEQKWRKINRIMLTNQTSNYQDEFKAKLNDIAKGIDEKTEQEILNIFGKEEKC